MYSNKLIFIIVFILFFTFPVVTSSAPEITINSYPSTTISDQGFDVNFSASGLMPNSNYYSKSLGGAGFNEVDTWNLNWLQQNAAWSSMPTFVSNAEGSASATIKSRFTQITSEGNKEYKLRIRKIDTDTNFDSGIIYILISTPIPTPTPTSAPTATPTTIATTAPTATPVATKTATATPIPTKKATPKPTSSPTPKVSETPDGLAFVTDNLSTASPQEEGVVAGTNTTKKSPFLSIIFIVLGLSFLGYVGYTFLKEKSFFNKNESI